MYEPSDTFPEDLAMHDWDDMREAKSRVDDQHTFGRTNVNAIERPIRHQGSRCAEEVEFC